MAMSTSKDFVMHGARGGIADGFTHIEEQVKGIEQAVFENPALAFDLARTLIESVCRKILEQRNVDYENRYDLPKLFKLVIRAASSSQSESSEGSVDQGLMKTMSGLQTTIQGICELRNQYGFASHGSGSPRPKVEIFQALPVAQAADAVIGFLCHMHRQGHTQPSEPRFQANKDFGDYKDNEEFNEYIDDKFNHIKIFDADFSASEILFQMEPDTYRIYLTEFNDSNPDITTSTE